MAAAGTRIGGDLDDLTVGGSPAPPGWVDGGTVSYTVLRGGALVQVPVQLGRLGTREIMRAFWASLRNQIYDFILPQFLGSLVIFVLAPRSGAAHLLLIASGPLFAMSTFVWAGESVGAQFVAGPIGLLFLTAASLWGWLFVPTLLLLVLSFPRRVWPVRRWPRRSAAAIYGLPITAWLVVLLSQRAEPYIAVLALSALLVVCCTIGITLHTLLYVRDPVLRAQTSWMALGIGVSFAFLPLVWSLTALVPGLNDVLERLPGSSEALLSLVIGMTFPLSMGIAITRYRLFDIDVLINRTLVYGMLTAMLGLIYLGSIVVLQPLLRPVVGRETDLATVVSTLAVAALFQPLRHRIQDLIDRRFYRRRYDAHKTLQAFGIRLRDETDLETLMQDVATVVQETLQPTLISVWVGENSQRSEAKQTGAR